MSKITEIMDELVALLAELYPEKHEHFNPYALELNDDMTLENGYSFSFGPAVNTNEMADGSKSIDRVLNFDLSVKVYGAKEDKEIRRTFEKKLLEDHFKFFQRVENDPTLDSVLALIQFVSDNGIEPIIGQEVL